jgi:hypothetical protein
MPTEPTAEELLELLAGGAALLGVTHTAPATPLVEAGHGAGTRLPRPLADTVGWPSPRPVGQLSMALARSTSVAGRKGLTRKSSAPARRAASTSVEP